MKRKITSLFKFTQGPRLRRCTAAWLAGLALLALGIPGRLLAVEVLYQETFNKDPHWGQGGGSAGIMSVANGQAVLKHTKRAPTDPDDVPAHWTSWATSWKSGTTTTNWTFTLQPGRTVEVRTDVVSFTHDDAFAGLWVGSGQGFFNAYLLMLDQNEIILLKGGFGTPDYYSISYFFWDSISLPTRPVTLSMRFTQVESDLQIDVHVFDTANPTNVRYKKTLIDTAGEDDMLPNRSIKGMLMEPEGIAAPYVGTPWLPGVGVGYLNPDQGLTMSLYVTIDNFQVLEYAAPEIAIEKNFVCLSWSEDTTEEQIVVSSDSLTNPVWTPLLEPIFIRNGQVCMNVQVTSDDQYFKLVPGTQFSDDFSGTYGPWHSRYAYHGVFQDGGKSYEIANGVLRVYTTGPWNYGWGIEPPPELGVAVRDFHAAVDVLSATTATNTWSTVGICARVEYDEPKIEASSCIGGIVLNHGSVLGNGRLYLYDNVTERLGPAFNFNPSESYRIEFSGVGPLLTLRVWNKTTGLFIGEMSVSDTKLTQGSVAFWLNAPPEGRQEIILDNFFVTGTRP